MSRELASWLLKQVNADQKKLDQDRNQKPALPTKNWDRPTLVVEGAVYRQLDVELAQAEIDAKKKIVGEYTKLLDLHKRRRTEEDSRKVEIWEHVVKHLAAPYRRRAGYRSSWRA